MSFSGTQGQQNQLVASQDEKEDYQSGPHEYYGKNPALILTQTLVKMSTSARIFYDDN